MLTGAALDEPCERQQQWCEQPPGRAEAPQRDPHPANGGVLLDHERLLATLGISLDGAIAKPGAPRAAAVLVERRDHPRGEEQPDDRQAAVQEANPCRRPRRAGAIADPFADA